MELDQKLVGDLLRRLASSGASYRAAAKEIGISHVYLFDIAKGRRSAGEVVRKKILRWVRKAA